METSTLKELYFSLTRQIHPGSLIVAVAFDLLWSIPEDMLTFTGLVFLIPFLMLTVFFACFIPITLIQRFGSADEWSSALTKGLILAVLAAVPYSFIGMGVAAFWGIMRLTYGVDQETILLGKLTRSWREIEITLRRLAPPEIRAGNLEDVINYLYNHRLLSNTLKDQLHELRRQRNANMHELSTQDLSTLVDQVQSMQNTLRMRFLSY